MSSSTPPSRSGSPQSGVDGGPGPGSGSGGSMVLTPLSPAAQSTSKAITGAVFATIPSCLMPEVFSGGREFADFLQQIKTAARLSGWQTATTDNRPLFCS